MMIHTAIGLFDASFSGAGHRKQQFTSLLMWNPYKIKLLLWHCYYSGTDTKHKVINSFYSSEIVALGSKPGCFD